MLNNINKILIADIGFLGGLDVSQYLDTIRYCRKNKLFFVRASKSSFLKKIVDPKLKSKRKSLYVNNIYEFLIDENPTWDGFPKRSKCIIGLGVRRLNPLIYSPSKFALNVYGSQLYYVFPKNLFDGGVAFFEKDDFISLLSRKTNYSEIYDFYSDIMSLFKLERDYHFDSMTDFDTYCNYVDDNLEVLYKNLMLMELTYDKSYHYFVKFMNDKDITTDSGFVYNLCNIFENLYPSIIYINSVVNNKTANIFFVEFIREVKKCLDVGFKRYVWYVLEPERCQILDESNIDYIDKSEFWTDEECLLVNAEYITEFYNEVENYLE